MSFARSFPSSFRLRKGPRDATPKLFVRDAWRPPALSWCVYASSRSSRSSAPPRRPRRTAQSSRSGRTGRSSSGAQQRLPCSHGHSKRLLPAASHPGTRLLAQGVLHRGRGWFEEAWCAPPPRRVRAMPHTRPPAPPPPPPRPPTHPPHATPLTHARATGGVAKGVSKDFKWMKDTRWHWNNWRDVIFRADGSFLAPAEGCEREGNPQCQWSSDDEKVRSRPSCSSNLSLALAAVPSRALT